MRRVVPWLAAAGVSLLFILIGIVFIPYVGAQYDEVLFADSIYVPGSIEFSAQYGHTRIPIMLMTYIGSLKAAMYAPVLHLLGNNHLSLRIPVLLCGAATLFLFFLIARKLSGMLIALAVSLLLATDAVYLLTCVFDWGPVALQHMLFGTALHAGFRYAESRSGRALFLCTFAAGLALWDKAIFIWLLAGFGLALLICFRRELFEILTTKHLAAAALGGFLLGAAPFIYYNASHRMKTFTANTQMDESVPLSFKLQMIDRTMDGSGLFGYVVREQPEGQPANLRIWEKVPLRLSRLLREPRSSWQHLLLVGALLFMPFAWFSEHRRVAVFLLVGAVLSTLLMITTRNAGASQHHTILLWPVPQLLLVLVLGSIAAKWPRRGKALSLTVILLCVISNASVLNQYLAQLISAGPALYWTNAIRPLVNELGRYEGRLVFAADWGISEQVQFYGAGKIGYDRPADGVVVSLDEPISQSYLERALADSRYIFVTHTEGREAFVGVRKRLLDFAASRGYRDQVLQLIRDRHSVPIFEIHEFRR